MQTTRRYAALLTVTSVSLVLARARHSWAAELREHAIGDPNAPVTIIEYASLSCHHCAEFHAETLPALKARYIDTGKVRLVLRDFPLEQNALTAAMIAHCSGPERYPLFVDVFFKRQDGWSHAKDPRTALTQLAMVGGMGKETVEACLSDTALEEAILQRRLQGQSMYGVRSTPTFVINGRVFSGNKSIDEFAAIIDPLLG